MTLMSNLTKKNKQVIIQRMKQSYGVPFQCNNTQLPSQLGFHHANQIVLTLEQTSWVHDNPFQVQSTIPSHPLGSLDNLKPLLLFHLLVSFSSSCFSSLQLYSNKVFILFKSLMPNSVADERKENNRITFAPNQSEGSMGVALII